MHTRTCLAALIALASLALLAPPASATDLAALWHLDESSGTTAADSSGNANHGTVNGAPQRIYGRFGRSLHFDGVDDNVFIAQSPTLEPAKVTVEGWVRAASSPGRYRHVISQGAYSCEVSSYALTTGVGGGIGFYVSNGNDDHLALSPEAPAAIWDGKWHHVAGTYDGSVARLFVDGVEVGSGTPAQLPIGYGLANPAGLLGAFGGTCQLNWSGDLDAPRVWRRALSSEELRASAAMAGPATVKLGHRVDSTQALVYTSEFSSGRNMQISTESSTGGEKITSVKLVGLMPLTSRASCADGLQSSVGSSCDFTLSNGGRTAALDVKPLVGEPVVTLRVTVKSGRTFDVVVDTSGRNALTLQASVKVSVGT